MRRSLKQLVSSLGDQTPSDQTAEEDWPPDSSRSCKWKFYSIFYQYIARSTFYGEWMSLDTNTAHVDSSGKTAGAPGSRDTSSPAETEDAFFEIPKPGSGFRSPPSFASAPIAPPAQRCLPRFSYLSIPLLKSNLIFLCSSNSKLN